MREPDVVGKITVGSSRDVLDRADGAPWRDVPERYEPWQTGFDRFNRWRKDGTLDRMLERLKTRLDKDGKLDLDL